MEDKKLSAGESELEVRGLQWLDTGHYRKKPPQYGYNPHDWNELCLVSDAQRQIAEHKRLLAERDARIEALTEYAAAVEMSADKAEQERDQLRALLSEQPQASAAQSAPAGERETIRAVFLRNGFTVKDGQTDLKPYVYAAAEELLSIARAAWQRTQSGVPECFKQLLHHAHGLTMGVDWNKGTQAGHHREPLGEAVVQCQAWLAAAPAQPAAQREWPDDEIVDAWKWCEENGGTPAEFLSHSLLVKRSRVLGRPLTWREAIELTAMTTNMPDEQRDKLLAIDDEPDAAAQDQGDGMCNADDPSKRCICREEFGRRVCAQDHGEVQRLREALERAHGQFKYIREGGAFSMSTAAEGMRQTHYALAAGTGQEVKHDA